ncbi:hypothetical protein QUB61_09730 [Microcoleus sp. C2D2]
MPVPQENSFFVERLGTGKMPVPQENSFFVARASCPFLTGILPVLDNGATSQVKQIYSVISSRVNQPQFRLSQSKI